MSTRIDKAALARRLKELNAAGVVFNNSPTFQRVMSIAINGASVDEPVGVLAGKPRKQVKRVLPSAPSA